MKTKILFIASEFASGMIPFAAKIITLLNKNTDFDVYAIVVNSGRKSYKEALQGMDACHLVQIEYPKSKWLKLCYKIYPYSIIRAIRRIEKKQCPNVVHLLTGDFTLAPYLFFRRNTDRWYYTVHDLHPHETKSNSFFNTLLHKYIIWGYKILRDNVANLTTSSQSQYLELKNLYPNKHVSFTHFPSLLTPQIQTGDRTVKELMGEKKDYILFFGTVDEYKGVDLLINAYLHSERLRNYKLVIAGKGLDYVSLINGNENIIRINRFIDDAEVKDLFTKSLFVVYPYRSATMSGVLSIAYYFKRRVLLSNIPFFMDNATAASTFFECGNISDLKAKMELMVSDKYDAPTLNDCYEKIYSEEVMVNDYYKLYSSK